MLNKGLQSELSQDFYRVVTNNQGQITFNPAQVVNVSLVVTEGKEPTVIACLNKSDKRIDKGVQVLVKDGDGYLSGYVVGSFKLLKKYLKDLRGCFDQKGNYLIAMVKSESGFERVYSEND